jgi:hypothetical protein
MYHKHNNNVVLNDLECTNLCRVAAVKSLNDVIFSILEDRSARHYRCACGISSFNFSAFSSWVVPIFLLE